jgi:hypothetical protein
MSEKPKRSAELRGDFAQERVELVCPECGSRYIRQFESRFLLRHDTTLDHRIGDVQDEFDDDRNVVFGVHAIRDPSDLDFRNARLVCNGSGAELDIPAGQMDVYNGWI